jgi:hypothetical protein
VSKVSSVVTWTSLGRASADTPKVATSTNLRTKHRNEKPKRRRFRLAAVNRSGCIQKRKK